MITLTGPGGIGKTRLAAEVVRNYRRAPAGDLLVHWVRLSRLSARSGTAAVEEEIAHAVIDGDFSGRSTWDALVDAFTHIGAAERVPRTLLVLDNCEHMLTSVANVVADLLEVVPELSVLATSREPIGWVDEHIVPVSPLTDEQAALLFRRRAELTGHPISGSDQIRTAARICHRLHNHPLYIQLAAARLRHQPPVAILRGLTGNADDVRLRWSHEVRVGDELRHYGISDAITWSYELCTDKERLLFDRLSVFPPGHTAIFDNSNADADVGAELDAIQTVCSDNQDLADDERGGRVSLAADEIEHLLERLVDHALVSVHRTSTTMRYALLESLRVYAQGRLRKRSRSGVDETAVLADRHLRYYRDRITYAAEHWSNSEEQHLMNWVRTTWANTVIAIETSLTSPAQSLLGLEICVGLFTMQSYVNGSLREMRRWTERCLDASRAPDTPLTEPHIAGMAALAGLALLQGSVEESQRMLEACATACLSDPDIRQNWRNTAERDIGLPASVEYAWGQELLLVHQNVHALDVFMRARDKFLAEHNYGRATLSEENAAFTAALLGSAEQSLEVTRRYYDRVDTPGTPWEKSWAESTRAVALTRHGDPAEALAMERSALAYQLTVDDWWVGMWVVLFRIWTLARLMTDMLADDRPDRVRLRELAIEIAHLMGGAATMAGKFGLVSDAMGPLTAESISAVAVASRILGPEEYTAAEARGRRLRPEHNEVQRLALGLLSIDTPVNNYSAERGPISHWHDLTRTEHEVAILAAAGWTNTAIAARRRKSTRTIDAQMTAILRKLAVSSREDIIEHIPQDTIAEVRTKFQRMPDRNNRKT